MIRSNSKTRGEYTYPTFRGQFERWLNAYRKHCHHLCLLKFSPQLLIEKWTVNRVEFFLLILLAFQRSHDFVPKYFPSNCWAVLGQSAWNWVICLTSGTCGGQASKIAFELESCGFKSSHCRSTSPLVSPLLWVTPSWKWCKLIIYWWRVRTLQVKNVVMALSLGLPSITDNHRLLSNCLLIDGPLLFINWRQGALCKSYE